MRSNKVKERIVKDMQNRSNGVIDMDPTVVYSRNPEETIEHAKLIENQDDADEQIEIVEETKEDAEVNKEYIFLIDRSGSMYQTIILARKALVLFLQSLPEGSLFNICSYGSEFEFLFKGVRSVTYNDQTLEFAQKAVSTFEADFGGTEIYNPLEYIFNFGAPKDCAETHIFLLTDGAVFNTDQVVDLVQTNANLQQRVHTFGVGSGASEELIKDCAFKGFGHYYFIYNEAQIEEKVVQSLTRTKLNYQVLQNIKI